MTWTTTVSDENLNTTAFFLLPPESACIPGIPEQLLLERVRVVMDVLVSYHRKEGRKEGRKEWMHACICRSESSGVWALAADAIIPTDRRHAYVR